MPIGDHLADEVESDVDMLGASVVDAVGRKAERSLVVATESNG